MKTNQKIIMLGPLTSVPFLQEHFVSLSGTVKPSEKDPGGIFDTDHSFAKQQVTKVVQMVLSLFHIWKKNIAFVIWIAFNCDSRGPGRKHESLGKGERGGWSETVVDGKKRGVPPTCRRL